MVALIRILVLAMTRRSSILLQMVMERLVVGEKDDGDDGICSFHAALPLTGEPHSFGQRTHSSIRRDWA